MDRMLLEERKGPRKQPSALFTARHCAVGCLWDPKSIHGVLCSVLRDFGDQETAQVRTLLVLLRHGWWKFAGMGPVQVASEDLNGLI